jgi:hypothetical protein
MSERGGPELSATQLVSGGLATATATVATSYLGVGGTIVGAAFMSVVTTAGAAVYKHYLDRGRTRTITMVSTEIRHHRRGHPSSPVPGGQEEAGITRVDHMEPGDPGDPAEPVEPVDSGDETLDRRRGTDEGAAGTRPIPADADAEPASAQTRPIPADAEPVAAEAEQAAPDAEVPAPGVEGPAPGAPAARRARWYVLAGAAVAIFAVVMGGVTLVEALTHKPLSAMVGNSHRTGTSLGRAFGGGGPAPSPQPLVPSTSPATTPASTPPPGVPSQLPSAPVQSPSTPPSTAPPVTPTTTLPVPPSLPVSRSPAP